MRMLCAVVGTAACLLLGTLAYRIVAGSDAGQSDAIQVFSGAGLMRPMEELCDSFEAETGTKVAVSYGGSGVLLGRLGTGRPCDVFVPGAAKVVEDAGREGWVDPASRVDLVLHVPVIAVSEEGAQKVEGIEDLAAPGVRVGLGAPEACAIGGAAERILALNGLSDRAMDNVCVRTPTVNQLLVYLVTGHIDAAIVWEDMMNLPEAAGKVKAVPIPASGNAVRTIAASRGSRSPQPERGEAFIRHLASDQGAEIWRKWGFTPCGE